jgi:hypothetical protein
MYNIHMQPKSDNSKLDKLEKFIFFLFPYKFLQQS